MREERRDGTKYSISLSMKYGEVESIFFVLMEDASMDSLWMCAIALLRMIKMRNKNWSLSKLCASYIHSSTNKWFSFIDTVPVKLIVSYFIEI